MRFPSGKTHYEILGVKRTASPEEIKRAFRSRAKRHHPDRNPGDPKASAKFNRINEAHEVLSDPGQRRSYDQSLAGDGAARPREKGIRPTPTRSYAPPYPPRGSAGSAIERYDERRARRPSPPQTRAAAARQQREAAATARQARQDEKERQARLAEKARRERLAEQAARQRMQENIRSESEPEQETSEDSGAAACGCILGVAVLIAVIIAIAQCG